MAKSTVDWKKRILLPIWIIRICLMLVVIIGFAIAVGLIKHIQEQWTIKLGAAIVFLLFAIIVLLLDVLQIVMFARHNLQPNGFVIMNSVQTGFWGGVVLMDIVEVAKNRQSPRALALVVVMFLLYLALLIYAIIGSRRHRRDANRGHYAPAHNPAAPAAMQTPYSGPMYHQQSTAYHSPMHNGGDLGQSQSLYPTHGEAADYYVDQPAKPAQMV
ncbi:hypothetical protein N0V90_007516 [Kalmusia sp. IMI 367209]|nr:hypothetical protein N0V90_007516 [Kalmusia sp. IMI 367209]